MTRADGLRADPEACLADCQAEHFPKQPEAVGTASRRSSAVVANLAKAALGSGPD